jgi:hypothetical protein
MKLNLGSLAFNLDLNIGGGTPAWGTEMGQGDGYRFNFEDMSDFFTALVYRAIPDLNNITCPLGKGGNQRQDYDFVIASLFDKVYVNNIFVPNAQFILLIVKRLAGEHHIGRRTLKYSPKITYQEKEINANCYKEIQNVLNLNNKSAWFIDEINVKNQDEIHFTAYIVNQNDSISYNSTIERRTDMESHIQISQVGRQRKASPIFMNDLNKSIQAIYYGAPGTGKSFAINNLIKTSNHIRTTFHPDSDYSTFVGAYKPTMEEYERFEPNGTKSDAKRITYSFVPQAFLKAYINAWNNYPTPQFLIIEEINRGNCAQIFGDIFQLLDRNSIGFSVYPISADVDLKTYLHKTFKEEGTANEESLNTDLSTINSLYLNQYDDIMSLVLSGDVLLLPNNLYIYATMNTSDQSLFPIDSAFKRRWDWKYIPITNAHKNWGISANGKTRDWWQFIDAINKIIEGTTDSEDKKLGYFFAQAKDNTINAETFVAKVIFYLWNDVFKDYGFDDKIFQVDNVRITFPMFFQNVKDGETVNEELVLKFIDNVIGTTNIQSAETIDENNVSQ